MDSKDKKIITALRTQGRASVRELAKKTGLRPSTVHQRMQRLEQDKIIKKYTVQLDNDAIGEGFIVFMWVTTNEDLPSSFFQHTYVKEAFGVTGEYDLFVKLKFPTINEFNEYIISLRKQKKITKTLTQIVTITLKEEL